MELTYVQSRSWRLGATQFETVMIFADRKKAEKFYNEYWRELGYGFDVRMVTVTAEEFNH